MDTRERVLKMHQAGQTPPEIAKALGISTSGVHYHLKRMGISTVHPLKKDISTDQIRDLYQQGISIRDIAEELGIGDEALRRRMIRAGIERRSLKESVPRGAQNRHYKDGQRDARKKMRDSLPRKESWQVAAICLGHPLARGWIVHHMDENPTNNDPANLWLFPTFEHHSRYHAQLSRCQQRGIAADANQLVLENGGLKLPPPPAPIPSVHDRDPLALFDELRSRLQSHTEL